MASPGWRAILRGREESEDELNPGDEERVAEEEVRTLCSNCGFVVDVYCPGSKCKEGAPGAESVAPTNGKIRGTILDTIEQGTHELCWQNLEDIDPQRIQ
jgi:hypothetical protein